MTVWIYTLLIALVGYFAGFLGALTGLGGGIVIIPVLVLFFKVDIHYAMGASLISVLATSSGTALAYLRNGYLNIRIAMFLESGAVLGALIGALLVPLLSPNWISLIFGFVLAYSAYLAFKRREATEPLKSRSHPWALYFGLEGRQPSRQGPKPYRVQRVPLALFIITLAGTLSGLLGIGSGSLKVLAMDQALKLPYKVSATTSNFMIGITAAVSAGLYFSYGYIDPVLCFPVMLGVVCGAFSGAKILSGLAVLPLRIIFSLVIFILALEMLYKGFTGVF